MKWFVISLVFFLLAAALAFAQMGPPQPVYNQGISSLLISPADGIILSRGPTRALWMNNLAACTVSMQLTQDTANVSWSFNIGQVLLPVAAKIINASGTTCTGIVGIY